MDMKLLLLAAISQLGKPLSKWVKQHAKIVKIILTESKKGILDYMFTYIILILKDVLFIQVGAIYVVSIRY